MINPMYSLEQLRTIEQLAQAKGIDLMQRAARSIADWISTHIASSSLILMAVGIGNNGGDALWAGLNLQARGYNVVLFIPEAVKSIAAIKALEFCQENKITIIKQLEQLYTIKPDLLIDGLFGIGLNRMLSDSWQKIITALNELHLTNLAIDTPSGFDAYQDVMYGAAIQATTTLTFLSDKPSLHSQQGSKLCGHVIVDLLDLPVSMRPC